MSKVNRFSKYRRALSQLARAGVRQLVALVGVIWVAAPAVAQAPRWEVVAEDLRHPWAIAFPAPGQFLVTERDGRMLHFGVDGTRRELTGLPVIAAGGQGGLLDLILDRDFQTNRWLYFCYSEAEGSLRGTALARARWLPDQPQLGELQVIFRQLPKMTGNLHFGCRIAERADGTLILALGERWNGMQRAQTLDNHLGKTVRIHKDGRIPADNPFVSQPGARAEIWTYGHRNPQGLWLAPDGVLWLHEHGPQGGDEINRIEPGRNYGWPVISYGEQYGGGKIGAGITSAPGMEQPLHHWVPSIAPSGFTRVSSARYPNAWQGQFLVGSLKFERVHRIGFAGSAVSDQVLDAPIKGGVRDIRQAPDGWIYAVTDLPRGQLLRLRP